MFAELCVPLNPEKYQTVYQYAVGLDASKPWGNETPQATCCGGTGVENHVKYQEAAYFVNEETIWVALYMPTTAHWQQKGVTINQACEWPAERSMIRIARGSGKFTMKLRVPYWATEGFDVKLNGKSMARHYQPSSYVEIPSRWWTEGDVVEVLMPFTKHIDFGPDKMERTAAYERGGKTEYAPMWTGAFMYGPLVMATTGIKNWDEATIDVAADLSDVTARGMTLSHGGRTFFPDYEGDKHVTHYFRMNIPTEGGCGWWMVDSGWWMVDKSELGELLLIAKGRSEEQEAWSALTVKVPEYAPWAVHGFERMRQQYVKARPYMEAADGRYTQEEIDKVASALNAVINTMRPGNLPELEDLEELQGLVEKGGRRMVDGESGKVDDALSYARMVIRYVSDGSGTKDMIERATNQLKEVLK